MSLQQLTAYSFKGRSSSRFLRQNSLPVPNLTKPEQQYIKFLISTEFSEQHDWFRKQTNKRKSPQTPTANFQPLCTKTMRTSGTFQLYFCKTHVWDQQNIKHPDPRLPKKKTNPAPKLYCHLIVNAKFRQSLSEVVQFI